MDSSLSNWRLIFTAPSAGQWNMAVDEAILEAVGRGDSPPTLRLYAWDPPCLSLGYSQPFSDIAQVALQDRGWHTVRRPTGGRAILHTDELTYAVIAPQHEPLVGGSILESYQRLSKFLLAALSQLGIPAVANEKSAPLRPAQVEPISNQLLENATPLMNPVCFEVPSNYEITCQGKKLLGSAQSRRLKGVLQHGSFPLFGDIRRITQVLVFPSEAARQSAAQRLNERATTAESILGRKLSWDQAAQAFVQAFETSFDKKLIRADISGGELVRASELLKEKYQTFEWNQRL